MPTGFYNAGSNTTGLLATDNVDFSGSIDPAPSVTTDGQLLIGSTSTPNIKVGTLTSPDSSITIGYSSPNITIETASQSLLTWTDKATSFSAAERNGYFVTGTATGTLPASPNQGDTISFSLDTANVLTIQANTGQTIRGGGAVSSTAGSFSSNSIGDSLTLVYKSTGSVWISTSIIGTWTSS